MRLLLMFLFFTGIVLIIANQLITSNQTKTEYVYLPRDLDTYLREMPYATVVFGDLFSNGNVGPNNETGSTDTTVTGA